MPLTDLQIRTAKPQDKTYRKADDPGLFLGVHPNGSRYWGLAYRHLGKQKLLGAACIE
ncbi:Arm DNA-binding domain-containing protein [Cupriavidus gilardii]|uniref:Arm DNA-binding domain-containing protein n=1 Tax=Cupriavidus gilardii TaxID=82541 RepID=UPI001EE51DBC|nr:Arm DNA-binding domain-containing protein [Cupriavidus gilardii]MCG5262355.1 Arm DNA-binding domain-containing protein [Cupriavidus gilardii]